MNANVRPISSSDNGVEAGLSSVCVTPSKRTIVEDNPLELETGNWRIQMSIYPKPSGVRVFDVQDWIMTWHASGTHHGHRTGNKKEID